MFCSFSRSSKSDRSIRREGYMRPQVQKLRLTFQRIPVRLPDRIGLHRHQEERHRHVHQALAEGVRFDQTREMNWSLFLLY